MPPTFRFPEHPILVLHIGDLECVCLAYMDLLDWDITDGREMRWYLGFHIIRDRIQAAHTISINQQAYIEATVNKFWAYQCIVHINSDGTGCTFFERARALDTHAIDAHARRTIC
jgi:hypothetical protein